MNKLNRFFYLITILFSAIFIFSCATVPSSKKQVSRQLTDKGILKEKQLVKYFLSQNPDFDKKDISRLANLYIKEAKYEGINSDVAFAQMCLETGYLRFGNLVVPEMHNYCGLGAINAEKPGEWFETEQDGVRAHIQHLHAYGTQADVALKGKLIDNRYKFVSPRGKAPSVWELSKTWAADPEYGAKLDTILGKMQAIK